jgi:transposase
MSRLSMRPSPSRWETLETATRCCPACGGRLSCHYTNRRAVVTVDGLLGLRLKVRRCVNRGCARFHRAFVSTGSRRRHRVAAARVRP